jgi:hypothetical protein
MGDDEDGEYEAAGSATGTPVQLEFVEGPTLNGEAVEWSYRTVGGATARSGTEVGSIAVMRGHSLIGGGSTTTHGDLGPHDIGATRIHPLQYTAEDGDYELSITIGGDARSVFYRIQDRQIQAI